MTAVWSTVLANRLGADRVLVGGACARYRLGNLVPAMVASPTDEAEVAAVLATAARDGLGVVPWGGGTHQSFGRPPARYDLALDLGRLNRVLLYEPADMTITVQAGIRLADLARRLGESGQFLPLDPPLAPAATLGGVLATNLSGPLRCGYGTARDLVLGVRVVGADGTITKAGARVVKNATAYDLSKLYVGAYGTLGVVLEVSLRLYPLPPSERCWWLTGADLACCQEAAGWVLAGSHLTPIRLELLDAEAARACGCQGARPALLVSVAGVPEAIREQERSLAAQAGEVGGVIGPLERPEEAWALVRDFPWRSAPPFAGTQRVLWRGAVLPSDCAKAMAAIRGAATGAEMSMAATVSHGVLRGAFSGAAAEALATSVARARRALSALGGYLVVADAPEAVRARLDVWGPPPDGIALMQELRRAFDPRGILNPGRFLDGI